MAWIQAVSCVLPHPCTSNTAPEVVTGSPSFFDTQVEDELLIPTQFSEKFALSFAIDLVDFSGSIWTARVAK